MFECERGTTVELAIDDGGRPRSVSLPCGPQPARPLPEKRPEPLAELSPGLWYVDLTRATMARIEPSLARLPKPAVVISSRGTGNDAGADILRQCSLRTQIRWMHFDRLSGHFSGPSAWPAWVGVSPETPDFIAGECIYRTALPQLPNR